jgi:hypothetical protein
MVFLWNETAKRFVFVLTRQIRRIQMKKIIALILAVLLISSLLGACGASKSTPSVSSAAADMAQSAAKPPQESYELASQSGSNDNGTGSGLTESSINVALSPEKIIYSYSATIDTKTFDDTLGSLEALLGQYGAFIESSYVSGSSYGYDGMRNASYTIRVPVQKFASLKGALKDLGNVYNENTTSENITARFTDTQSRLDTYRTEESRLLAMLEKANTVEDMIAIEARLSDVRYQIESLTSTLRNWQNEVDYSTVTLDIVEVDKLKDQLPSQRTYWEKIGDGFTATLKGIGEFFKDFFAVLVVASPVLILLAVIAVVILIILRIRRKTKTPPPDDRDKPQSSS